MKAPLVTFRFFHLPGLIPPRSSSSPLLFLRGVSVIFCVTILTQHFLSLSSVSARSCPGAPTATCGQCLSLFASPPHCGNPGIAGNHWWISAMRSPSLFSLPWSLLPPPHCKRDVICFKTMEAFSIALPDRQPTSQTDRQAVGGTS